MLIYKITNNVNGKIYIGQTRRLLCQRKAAYKYSLTRNKHPNYVIERAMRKHGFESFVFELVDTCTSLDELNVREMFWIKTLDATNPLIGYNVSAGGNSVATDPVMVERRVAPLRGRQHSAEWKHRISDGLLGHEVSTETRERLSRAHKGKKNWRKGQRNWDVRVCACGCKEIFECAPARVKMFKDRRHSKIAWHRKQKLAVIG